MRNERGSITGETLDIKRIKREYYEKLICNSDKTDKFLEKYKFQK